MKETIEKITNFLKEEIVYYDEDIKASANKEAEFSVNGEPLSIKDLKENRANTKDLLYFLEASKETLLEENAAYTGFYFFSTVIEHVPLSSYEKLNLIMYVIEKSYYVFENRKEKNPILIDINRLKELLQPNMRYTDFKTYLQEKDIFKIIRTKEEELNEEERFLKEKILEVFNQTQKAQNHIVNCHRLVKEHYLDKINSYDEKDMKFVRNALLGLDVSPNLVGTIMRILSKTLEKRKQETSPKLEPVKSDYDYKTLSKEVESFIDLNTMDPKRTLTKEEEIQVLIILARMHIDREQRRTFLRKSEMLIGSKHPIAKYLENYDKLKYYEAKVGIQNELKDMEEYFGNLFLADEETYVCSREYLAETLRNVNPILPKNFEYEEERVNLALKK